jgi:hypothetical protein
VRQVIDRSKIQERQNAAQRLERRHLTAALDQPGNQHAPCPNPMGQCQAGKYVVECHSESSLGGVPAGRQTRNVDQLDARGIEVPLAEVVSRDWLDAPITLSHRRRRTERFQGGTAVSDQGIDMRAVYGDGRGIAKPIRFFRPQALRPTKFTPINRSRVRLLAVRSGERSA